MDRLTVEKQTIGEEPDSVTVLSLSGYVDASNVDEFEVQVEQVTDGAGPRRVVVSLQGLEYINSSGLGVLISGNERLSERGAFCLAAVPRKIERIIRLLGFGAVVRMYDTVEEALEQAR